MAASGPPELRREVEFAASTKTLLCIIPPLAAGMCCKPAARLGKRVTSTLQGPRWSSRCASSRWQSGTATASKAAWSPASQRHCSRPWLHWRCIEHSALLLCRASAACSYQDGAKPASQLHSYAAKKRLQALPSPLEFLSYLFAAGNLLAGGPTPA